jgi:hypothetical protein
VLASNANVIVPAVSKMYLVTNACTGPYTVTVKTASGTGVVVSGSDISIVYCDGTNVIGTPDNSAEYAKLAERNAYTKGNADVIDDYADAATITFDCAESNVCRTVLNGDRTLAFSNPVNGSWLELYIVQDGSGNRVPTWPGNVLWCGGVAPTLSHAPSAVDRVFLRYHLGSDRWLGVFQAAPPQLGGSVINISQSIGETAVDLFTKAGRPAGAVTVNYTVGTGVILRALNAREPALNLSGFASGSVINITNRGYILGAGGNGGNGGSSLCTGGDNQRAVVHHVPTAGGAGGDAIRGAGTGVTINITNATGYIWGGGGGGGGGGGTVTSSAANSTGLGGGGGAGAGGGEGGLAGSGRSDASTTLPVGNAGTGSAGGVSSAAGSGGAGAENGAAGEGGDGGAGGDWGTVGTAGTSPTTYDSDLAGGAAGAAGKAVAPNSSTISFVSGGGSPNIKGAVV